MSTQSTQSTNHIMLIEPAEFYLNPETQETNVYQVDGHESHEETYHAALGEFRRFHNMLVSNGVAVTVVKGSKGCPDHLFPNWASTHEVAGARAFVLYPMLNENRRAERTPAMIELMGRSYHLALDLRAREKEGAYLEATGSLCLDRVNKVAYVALSQRTNEALAREWGAKMGYEVECFETLSHTGKPVYHSDLVMFIGSTMAGVCLDCIVGDEAKARIRARLAATHDVMELTAAQQKAFCGNSLEVMNTDGERLLVMSGAAFRALREDQLAQCQGHFSRIIHSDIPTIETYGGGSARCLMMEMF